MFLSIYLLLTSTQPENETRDKACDPQKSDMPHLNDLDYSCLAQPQCYLQPQAFVVKSVQDTCLILNYGPIYCYPLFVFDSAFCIR